MAALRFATLLLWVPLFTLTAWNQGATSTSSHIATRVRGAKKWGDQCNDTLQCGYDNALCTDGQRRVCACHPDFPATNKKDKCDVPRNINETCAFNEQCEMAVPRTECRGGLCACRLQSIPHETNGTWSCRIRGAKKWGDQCNDTLQCGYDNALCTDGQRRVCACHPDFPATNKKDKCDVPRSINETCAFNEQCEMAVPRTECRGGLCACRFQSIPYETNGTWSCRIRGAKKWGDQCNDTLQCGYDNALCTDGQRRVCACHPDFPATNKKDKCDVPRVINQTCAFNEQCEMAVPRTECRGGLCACRFGMTPQQTNETWSCRSVLGSHCNATHVCHQDDDSDKHALQCYKGKCQCKGIFMPEDGMCKKKIDVLRAKCSPRTDICYADSEGPRRQCTNGSCQCKSSFVIENAVCKQKINLLGAPCNATVDICYLDEDGNQQKRHCKDGVCQCKAEFTLTSDKKCQKLKSGNNHAEARFVGRLAWIPLIAVISVIR